MNLSALALIFFSILSGQEKADALQVIVTLPPDQLSQKSWQTLAALPAIPKFAVTPSAPGVGQPFDFTVVDRALIACASHQLPAALLLTAHFPYLSRQSQIDEEGKVWTDRHNPFDPVFLAEWTRFCTDFSARYAHDNRIERVYLTPPSYFGETEYYMGDDWVNQKFLAYDDLARASFIDWLTAHYQTPAAVSKAWGQSFIQWEELELPRPDRKTNTPHLETAWFDFNEWRGDHLRTQMSARLQILAKTLDCQVTFMCSVGDYSATWATDSTGILASAGPLPNLALHGTNGHSLCDLRLMLSNVRCFGIKHFICENDGERYGRSEFAKIALNALLAGVDEYNFAHERLLFHADAAQRTSEIARIVGEVGKLLDRNSTQPVRSPIAFLHSRTTDSVRAPHYWNFDVPHVYDAALGNGARPEVQGYSWARYLGLPDVIGEDHLSRGGLEGVRMLILPNTSLTLLPDKAAEQIDAWIQSGGVLVVFGADGYRWRLHPPTMDRPDRIYQLNDWNFPAVITSTALQAFNSIVPSRMLSVGPHSVWNGSLPEDWTPILIDDQGAVACAWQVKGNGGILLFPGPIPQEMYPSIQDIFYARTVPLFLMEFLESRGISPVVQQETTDGRACCTGACEANPVIAMALGQVELDEPDGCYRFVAGAYDGSVPRVRLSFDEKLKGPAELLLVDMEHVAAHSINGATVEVTCSKPDQATIYSSPYHRDTALIPITTVRFNLPDTLELVLQPE